MQQEHDLLAKLEIAEVENLKRESGAGSVHERIYGVRKYWSEANAYCETCGAEWRAKNAHGVAVQHARKHGHVVSVEVKAHHTYDCTGLVT